MDDNEVYETRGLELVGVAVAVSVGSPAVAAEESNAAMLFVKNTDLQWIQSKREGPFLSLSLFWE